MGVSTQLERVNLSHPSLKWIAAIVPNVTAWDQLYKKEYEGTGRPLFVCTPNVVGKYPDWFKGDLIWGCINYTSKLLAEVNRRDEWGYIYNGEKPFVDITIGIAAVVTTVGVPGK